jgi:hypothetical protein
VLSTYSAAVAVRAGLAAAGLELGRGPRVGAKAEGTLAVKGFAGGPLAVNGFARLEPLAPRVARRVARRAAELRAARNPTGHGIEPAPLA